MPEALKVERALRFDTAKRGTRNLHTPLNQFINYGSCHMSQHIGIEDQYGHSVALQSVHLEGRLEGLLLTMKLRQTYRNDKRENLEVTYTFPAGWGSHLLSFSVELGDQKLKAQALPKKTAEAEYEQAISSGDTPVMLEKSPHGLYTANIGNLKPEEIAVVELEYAQLLRFEHGRLRITVPTVIGSRYGDGQTEGGLAPHQSTGVNALAEYPFSAVVDVVGDMATGEISCPTWDAQLHDMAFGKRLSLRSNAYLDRDLVVLIENLKSNSFATASKTEELVAVVASFCPKLTDKPPQALNLKVLVDCSGSMEGESMEQAQEAMHELSFRLCDQDHLSYSKFGSKTVHSTMTMEPCTQAYLRDVLANAVYETQADLGGTEMVRALKSTFKIKRTDEQKLGFDLLLITDGDVWDIDEIVVKAKKSGHRIFAIGVGSAPAESLLRELADQTGGACELVTPSERIAEAVIRMLQRMRSPRSHDIRIDWGAHVIWQSKMPLQVFSEETVHAFALMASPPEVVPTLSWKVGEVFEKASPGGFEWKDGDTLLRVVAGAKLTTIQDTQEATDWAVKYQLVSAHTNLLLVHVRDEADKAQGLPTLEMIQQMQASGWGGYGSSHLSVSSSALLRPDSSVCYSMSMTGPSSAPTVFRSRLLHQDLPPGGLDDIDIPAFLRKQVDPNILGHEPLSPELVLSRFNELALKHSKFFEIVNQLMHEIGQPSPGGIWNTLRAWVGNQKNIKPSYSAVWELIRELVGDKPDQIDLWAGWACTVQWLSEELSDTIALNRHAQRILNYELQKSNALMSQKLKKMFTVDKTSGDIQIKRLEHVD